MQNQSTGLGDKNMKYLILGAGPAGLTVANMLKQKGITDFLVLEREATAGGLCRSVDVDGAPFDIGGGHFPADSLHGFDKHSIYHKQRSTGTEEAERHLPTEYQHSYQVKAHH